MRTTFLSALTLACAAAMLAAQTSQAQPPAKKPPKTIALTGCVAADETTPDQVNLVDTKKGRTYRLAGLDLHDYLGQQVTVWGGTTVKGVHIGTGLGPSPNVAAQAGSIDPVQAAMAAAPGGAATGTGTATLPEFVVKTVKSLQPVCPPAK